MSNYSVYQPESNTIIRRQLPSLSNTALQCLRNSQQTSRLYERRLQSRCKRSVQRDQLFSRKHVNRRIHKHADSIFYLLYYSCLVLAVFVPDLHRRCVTLRSLNNSRCSSYSVHQRNMHRQVFFCSFVIFLHSHHITPPRASFQLRLSVKQHEYPVSRMISWTAVVVLTLIVLYVCVVDQRAVHCVPVSDNVLQKSR